MNTDGKNVSVEIHLFLLVCIIYLLTPQVYLKLLSTLISSVFQSRYSLYIYHEGDVGPKYLVT